MNNIFHNVEAVKAKSHAQATGTATGDAIDVSQYDNVSFVILTAATTTADGSNYFTFSVVEGDDSGLSDAAAVPSDRLFGSAVINDAGQDNVVLQIGAKVGLKKYMGLKWTETGTADATFGAVAMLGGARHQPVN